MDRRLVDPGNLVGTAGTARSWPSINQIDPIYVYFNISDLDLARLLKSHGRHPRPRGRPEMAGVRGPAQ